MYSEHHVSLAAGDTIRITAGGKTKDGEHRLENGNLYTIRAFNGDGDLVLNNGWVVDREFGFIALGYNTSYASQGKTVDRVLIADSEPSLVASGREQMYVSLSRGRYQATVYTDNTAALKEAAKRSDARVSATEFVSDGTDHIEKLMREARARTLEANRDHEKTFEVIYERN